jgi:tRNA (cytidine/uridine-2'-O-)-methyltransferase
MVFFEPSGPPMLQVILYQPEIPPNTGNIIRLCANAKACLHLIGPLGFVLDDARVRRAGLDYDELTDVRCYVNWQDFLEKNPGISLWAFSTHGSKNHNEAAIRDGDGLLFGPETRGLPADLLDRIGADRTLRIPMQKDSRSLNLSNTVAIGLYEALRQLDFPELM